MADSIGAMTAANDAILYPVATGELEGPRYSFERLVADGAADVLQPDSTVCGGITEWLKVAYYAAANDIRIAPHYNWNLHASLLGAIENGLWVKYFHRDMDVKVFDDIVACPLRPDETGMIPLPDDPGHGVRLDEDTLKRFAKTN